MKTEILSANSAADLMNTLNGREDINVISVWSIINSADKETFFAFVQYA